MEVAPTWNGETVLDLHREYPKIFRHGNRNAASHLWASFIIERAPRMARERVELMFSGFCAVSGSPVRPSDYARYRLELPTVAGGGATTTAGFMYYCCWPCVCDTQDFIRVDTLTVGTADEGPVRYNVAVIGNPCDRPEALDEPFVQPFGHRTTTLRRDAPEVRCGPGGVLEGATMSDHGFVVISLFFPAEEAGEEEESSGSVRADTSRAVVGPSGASGAASVASSSSPLASRRSPQPGRMSRTPGGVPFQDEAEYSEKCDARMKAGYDSGMGEIFRRVASISPIGAAFLAAP